MENKNRYAKKVLLAFALGTAHFSVHAAGVVWQSPVQAPVAYDDSGMLAPLQTLPALMPSPPEVLDTLQLKRLVTHPLGYTLASYSALTLRSDNQPALQFGLQLRAPDGTILANQFEPYNGDLSNSSLATPKGHDASYIAMSQDRSSIWAVIRDDNGEKIQCRIANYGPTLQKRSDIPCSSENLEQQIHLVVPLSNKLAAVQYTGSLKNALISREGAVSSFNQTVGKILTSLLMPNGNTVLLTTPDLNPGQSVSAEIVMVNSRGKVLRRMPVHTSNGQALQAARYEIRRLDLHTLLIAARSDDGDNTPHTTFVALDARTGVTKWSNRIDAAVDFDVKGGKTVAVGGNENDPNQDPYAKTSNLYEFSYTGVLKVTPIDQPLGSYLAVQYFYKSGMIGNADVLSALSINPNNTVTLLYTDYYAAIVPPHMATEVKIDRTTGHLIDKNESHATFHNIGRDAFNNLYRIKSEISVFGFDNSFNLNHSTEIYVEKYKSW